MDTRFRDRTQTVEGHVSAGFELHPMSIGTAHRLLHVLDTHIIQHDNIGSGFQSGAELIEIARFDCDPHQMVRAMTGKPNCFAYAPGRRDMIFFY